VSKEIKKRDATIVDFDSSKITAAIASAGKATGEFGDQEAENLTLRVLRLAHELHIGPIPEVEEVQNIVERILLDSPFYRSVKAYIIYREQHTKIRDIVTRASTDLVENYIQKLDWKIKSCPKVQTMFRRTLKSQKKEVNQKTDNPLISLVSGTRIELVQRLSSEGF